MHTNTIITAGKRYAYTWRLSYAVVTVLYCMSLIGGHVPAYAASSWGPTVIADTEAFKTLDEGDGATNIQFRFGQTLNESITYDRTNNRFAFSRSVKIGGNLTTTGAAIINIGNTTAAPDTGIALEVIGTASGTDLFATKSLRSSGSLVVRPTGQSVPTLFANGTQKVGIRTGTPGSQLAVSGSVIFSPNGNLGSTAADAGIALEITGTASGADILAQKSLRSSGSLVVDGSSIFEGALTFGDVLGDAVTINAATWTFVNDTNFVLSGGVNGLSFDTNTLSIDATGDQVGIGTTAPKTKLEIAGTASGQNLFATKSVSGANLYAATTIGGAGLTNCTGTTAKLTWLASIKQFACETDETGGGGASFGTGNVITIGDSRYVNTAGDTMTGALIININGAGGNGTGLVLRERAYLGSGATLSGSLVLKKRAVPGKTGSGVVGVFDRELAGRSMLHAIDSTGVEYPLQPGLDKSVFLIAPAATTTVTTYGTTTTNSATLSHPTPTEALPYATNFATSTTSGNESGLISVNTIAFRGSTTGFNGFYYHARIIVIDTASMIAFSGLTSASSLANVFGGTSDPAGHHAGFQFSTVRADANWQFITKDNVTLNVVNTGMTFTANSVYELYMYVDPQGTTVYWRVDNRTAGTSAEGSTTSNLPGSSTALRIATGVETQTTAAKSLRSSRIYLEANR